MQRVVGVVTAAFQPSRQQQQQQPLKQHGLLQGQAQKALDALPSNPMRAYGLLSMPNRGDSGIITEQERITMEPERIPMEQDWIATAHCWTTPEQDVTTTGSVRRTIEHDRSTTEDNSTDHTESMRNQARILSCPSVKDSSSVHSLLATFHDEEYLEALKRGDYSEDFGLVDDCAPFPLLWPYVCQVAQGSVVAARALADSTVDIAIHWDGGRHHAKRDEAGGFCYVNDAVLAILELRKSMDKVLYLDVDVHHGDGVEQAFQYSPNVFTLSFHHYSAGFFPGSLDDRGKGKAHDHCLNIPLHAGLDDATFAQVLSLVASRIHDVFQPDAVVMVCGADGLAGDPNRIWNLTEKGLLTAVEVVRRWNLPLLLLGGGGYHSANTARVWTQMTALALGRPSLSSEIPEHTYFEHYQPSFQLGVDATSRRNENEDGYIQLLLDTVDARFPLLPLEEEEGMEEEGMEEEGSGGEELDATAIEE